ncbi:MAG: hypothetical protein ACRD30_04645 [Bryobacteraceae bacterium]
MKYLALGLLALSMCSAQTPNAPGNNDAAANFQTGVSMVLVPVVVRDSRGRAVGSLQKQGFELKDRGKVQTILEFSVKRSPNR